MLNDPWPETFVSCHPLNALPVILYFELSNEGQKCQKIIFKKKEEREKEQTSSRLSSMSWSYSQPSSGTNKSEYSSDNAAISEKQQDRDKSQDTQRPNLQASLPQQCTNIYAYSAEYYYTLIFQIFSFCALFNLLIIIMSHQLSQTFPGKMHFMIQVFLIMSKMIDCRPFWKWLLWYVKCEHTSTSSLLQVGPHAVVVGEYWGCGSNFCSHVANGGHSCTQKICQTVSSPHISSDT